MNFKFAAASVVLVTTAAWAQAPYPQPRFTLVTHSSPGGGTDLFLRELTQEYTDGLAQDPALRALAAKVRYRVDPSNPCAKQVTGHLRVTMQDGRVVEQRQGWFKGGAEHPLSDADILFKFHANCAYGGLPRAQAEALASTLHGVVSRPRIDSDTPPR